MHPQTCACMHACMHARTHIDTHTHTLTHSHTPYTDSHTSTMICDKTKSIHIYRDVSSKKIGTGCASLDTAAASRFTALARRLLSRLSHLPANSQNLSIVQIQFFFWFWWTLFFRLQFLARNTLSVRTRCSRAIFSRQNRQIHQKKKWERKRIHTQPRNGPHCCVETSTLIIFVFFENFRNLSRQICAYFKML